MFPDFNFDGLGWELTFLGLVGGMALLVLGWGIMAWTIVRPRCEHTAYLDAMRRRADGQVECQCDLCGELLVRPYGLAIPMKWKQRKSIT